jgi:hypothetical protein
MKGEEKYLIIRNAQQYFVVMRCARQTVVDYIEFGQNNVRRKDGSIDLQKIATWLTNRGISYRAGFFREENFILRRWMKKEIKKVNRSAIKNGLFLSSDDMENIVSNMKHEEGTMCWNLIGI